MSTNDHATVIETRRAFAVAVERRGGSRKVAEELRLSRSYVDMIITGLRTPNLRAAARIEALTGIDVRAWVHDPEWTAPTTRFNLTKLGRDALSRSML